MTTDKVYLNLLYRAAPPVETKDFVCEIDDLFRRKIVNFSASCTWSCRYVFWTKLTIEPALERCNFLCRVFVDVWRMLFKWVHRRFGVAILITWPGDFVRIKTQ